MEFQDYYKVLGVDKNATADQIKKAYRKLAVKYHPDKAGNDKKAEDMFKRVNEANDVLSDQEKRKKYDALGENWKYYDEMQAQGGGGFGGGQSGQRFRPEDFMGGGGGGGFSDFFEQFFGGGGGHHSNRAFSGHDTQATLPVSLEEAFHGVTKTFTINGQTLNLKLKPGIADEQILKLKGRGAPGANGGAAGDLLITIQIKSHAKYERKGDDIYLTAELNSLLAIAGGKLPVTTLHKSVNLTIPAGTEQGKLFRLPKLGMPRYGDEGNFGDAFVRIQLHTPTNLSKEDLEKIESIINRTS
jgi:curved DNA-binding protein